MIVMLRKLLPAVLAISGCVSSNIGTVIRSDKYDVPTVVGAVPLDKETVLIAERLAGRCAVRLANSSESVPLSDCPREIRRSGRAALALSERGAAILTMRSDGKLVTHFEDGLLDQIETTRLVRKQNTMALIDGTNPLTVDAARFTSGRLLPGRRAFVAFRPEPAALVRVGEDGSVVDLLPSDVRELDSVDVSPDGKEVVFSGRRDAGFDIALVSADGSEPRWVYPDVLDEVNVTWAPRGSKITYAVEGNFGTILRSVHVPTSWQLAVDLPFSRVISLVWEPSAEQFAVVKQGSAERPNAEMISFGGEIRRPLTGNPSVPGEPEPLGDGVLIRSTVSRYNEKVPLVVMVDEEPLRFREATAILRRGGIAVAILPPRSAGEIEGLSRQPWVDPSRFFAISRTDVPSVHTYRIAESQTASEVATSDRTTILSGPRIDRLELIAAERILERIR